MNDFPAVYRRCARADLLLAAILLGSAWAGTADAAYVVRGYVIGSGPTPSTGITGSGRKLYGTAGQPAIGRSTGTNRVLCHGFWCWGGTQVVSVQDPGGVGSVLPGTPAFGPPRPNPVREAVFFAVDLPRAARVDLRVLDVQGRLVHVIESGPRDAGFHTLTWDGRDDARGRAGAGVYFARLAVDGVPIGTRRLIVRR